MHIVLYDDLLPRRLLYAHHIRREHGVEAAAVDSVEQLRDTISGVDVLVLSFGGDAHVKRLILDSMRHMRIQCPVLVIDSEVYTESDYAGLQVFAFFHRPSVLVAEVFAGLRKI